MELVALGRKCIQNLEIEIPPEDFNTWIRPLQIEESNGQLMLLAPNRFVMDCIREKFFSQIIEQIKQLAGFYDIPAPAINLQMIGSKAPQSVSMMTENSGSILADFNLGHVNKPNPLFTFDNFVEGKSNQMARAAAVQVAKSRKSL